MIRFGDRRGNLALKEVKLELKKQIKGGRIKPRRLFKKLYRSNVKTLYAGKLYLENENIKIKGITRHYMESLKNVLQTKCEDEELIQNEPDLTVCCYVEKKIANCKIKSCKSPKDGCGISLNYNVINDRLFNNFHVKTQIAVLDCDKILYGNLSPHKNYGEEPFVNIVLCHSSKLGGREIEIYKGLETTFFYEDLDNAKNVSNSVNSFFNQNIRPQKSLY